MSENSVYESEMSIPSEENNVRDIAHLNEEGTGDISIKDSDYQTNNTSVT